MARFLVLSCSLNETSRSHRLAVLAREALADAGEAVELVDLRDYDLPFCDGGESYGVPQVKELNARIKEAAGLIVAAPIYNYDLNAAAKNVVELTGRSWTGKTVGFAVAAGGRSSYMAPLGMANSLMADFRCVIAPRFVYAAPGDFTSEGDPSPDIHSRIERLAGDVVVLASVGK